MGLPHYALLVVRIAGTIVHLHQVMSRCIDMSSGCMGMVSRCMDAISPDVSTSHPT